MAADSLAALVSHPEYVRGDPEALVHLDWNVEWRGCPELFPRG